MDFHFNLTIFYQTSPHFEGALTSCVAVMAQIIYVCGYRPVLYYSKDNINFLGRFMKSGVGVMDQFVLQPHHFILSQSQFRRKTDKFCCCSGPKHMCVWL